MLRLFRTPLVTPVCVWLLVMIASLTPIYAQESPDAPVPITAENAPRLRQVAVFGGGRITQPAWSPDGQTIAVAGTQGVWLYDAEDSHKSPILFTLDPGEGEISSLVYSPDGAWLATGSATGETRLWNLETGESERILIRNDVGRGRSSVAFSPDGTLLAIGDEATIHLYDMEGQTLQPVLDDVCDGYIASLDFSPDGRLLACGTTSLGDASMGMVGIWDLTAGRGLHTIRMDWMWMMTANVAFSPDGESLYIWDSERFFYDDEDYANPAHAPVRQWNISEESYVPLPGWWHESLDFAFSPSGEYIASVNLETTDLRIQSLSPGAGGQGITGSLLPPIGELAFSPDPNNIELAYIRGNTLIVWPYKTNGEKASDLRTYPYTHSGIISQIAFSGDGRYLASMSPADNLIQVWDIATKDVTNIPVEAWYRLTSLALNSDGTKLLTATRNGSLLEWMLPDYEQSLQGGKIEDGYIFDIAYMPDDRITVLGCTLSLSATSWLGEIFPGSTLAVPENCENSFVGQFRRDAETYIMATSGSDAHVALYGVTPSRLIKRWTDTELITAADLSLSGGVVAVGTGYEGHGGGGIETSLTLLRTDGESTTLVTPEDTYNCASFLSIVRGLAFSPDDRLLAVASGDSRANGLIVEVWDVRNETRLVTLEGHTDIILDVAFSPDGSMLATAGRDGMIRLWAVGDTPVIRAAPECPPFGQG